ncbi:hypothetical protein C2S52_013165 [Perilla frutescens var. hirtella]|nr:hypothetical protein C2S52_013165 [Perilla frutescens var. hirtella]
MKLTTSLRGGGTASFSFSFFRRRLRSNGSFRGGRASPFFTSIGRKRGGAAAENPEPSSPKVTCIGQVRVKSQKKVKQCRRRIGEASFRSVDQSFPPPQQRWRWRDQRWVHLPNISVVLRAFGEEFCCLFRCSCCCFTRREREKGGCYANGNGCGALLGRWLVAVNGGEGERRREIEVVVGGGDEEATEKMSAGNSRRHVFDDIEVKGDRIEVKGMSVMNGEREREATRVSISIPPKNALLLMRCRSDPIKMAAIANRISSDSARYENSGIEEEEDEYDDDDGETTSSSDELFEGQHKIFVAQVLEEMHNVGEINGGEEKLFISNEEKKLEEIQLIQEEEETVKSNMSSFENAENYQDETEVEAKSEPDENQDSMIVQEGDDEAEEKNAVASDKLQAHDMPGNQETETAAVALPECLLLMMREPKLSMEVSKETWICATDFIRLLPDRPRRAASKAAVAGGDHEPVVRRRASVEKSCRPRVPAPPCRKNYDVQPARSSCSLPAASTAAVIERKRVNCEPLALTRCKSEPMSTAAAKLMPEAGCWKDNVEPHRQAALGVGAAGVGF